MESQQEELSKSLRSQQSHDSCKCETSNMEQISKSHAEQNPDTQTYQIWSNTSYSNLKPTNMHRNTVYDLDENGSEFNLLPNHNIFSRMEVKPYSENQRPQAKQNYSQTSRCSEQRKPEEPFEHTAMFEERSRVELSDPNFAAGDQQEQTNIQAKYTSNAFKVENGKLNSLTVCHKTVQPLEQGVTVEEMSVINLGKDTRSFDLDFEQGPVNVSLDGTTQLERQRNAITYEHGIEPDDVDMMQQTSFTRSPQSSPTTPQLSRHVTNISPHSQSISIQGSNHSKGRITKHPQRSKISANHLYSQKNISLLTPSEEDLMLLMMRWKRKSNQSHSTLIKACDRLKAENAELQSTCNASDIELQQTRQQWQILTHASHVQEADLRKFKDKYSKLKQWVLSIEEDHEKLQRDRDKFSSEIAFLRSGVLAEVSMSKELLEKCEVSVSKASNIKEDISKLRADTYYAETVRKQLSKEQEQLREEKLRNKTYALYIERLERSQHTMQASFNEKQDGVVIELAKIASAMKKQSQNSTNEVVGPLLESFELLREQMTARSITSHEFREAMAALEHNSRNLKEIMQRAHIIQTDWHVASSAQNASIVDCLHNLKPELQNFQLLEREKATLAETTQHVKENLRTTQREKQHLQLLTIGLMEAHKQVIVNATRTSVESDKASEFNEEISRQRALVHSKEKEIYNLKTRLTDVQKVSDALKQDLSDVQNKYQAHSAQLLLEHQDELNRRDRDMKTKIDLKDQLLATSQADLVEKQQESSELQSELEKFRLIVDDLKGQIMKLTDEITLSKRQITHSELIEAQSHELHTRTQNLEREKGRLLLQVEDLKIVQEELHNARADKEVLQDRLDEAELERSKLEQATTEVKALSCALEAANEKDHELREKLSELAHVQTDLIALRQSYELLNKQKEGYATELSTAKQEEAKVLQLNQDINIYKSQINELTQSLETFKSKAAQVESLQSTLGIAQEANTKAIEELKISKSRVEELHQYETQVKDKAAVIENLTNHVSELRTVEQRLQKAIKESKQKDMELATMQEQIQNLEDKCRSLGLFNQYFSREELSALTEETLMLFKMVLSQSQSEQIQSEDSVDDDEEVERSESRLRVAPNSPIPDTDNDIEVPDSQSQGKILSQSEPFCNPSVGLFNQHLDPIIETGATSLDSDERLFDQGINDYSILTSGPSQAETRPETTHDEMLFRSSDSSNLSTGRVYTSFKDVEIGVTSSPYVPSPMKTRGGSQIRHVTPTPRAPANSQSPGPHPHPREPVAPNSAAKRRASQEPEGVTKRARSTNLKNLKGTASRTSTPKSTRFASQDTIHQPPNSASRGESGQGSTAPAPGKPKKRTNTTRKTSKDAAYAAQFGTNL